MSASVFFKGINNSLKFYRIVLCGFSSCVELNIKISITFSQNLKNCNFWSLNKFLRSPLESHKEQFTVSLKSNDLCRNVVQNKSCIFSPSLSLLQNVSPFSPKCGIFHLADLAEPKNKIYFGQKRKSNLNYF